MTNRQRYGTNDEVIFADADWHSWSLNRFPHTEDEDDQDYPWVGFSYVQDWRNERNYSLLRMSDAMSLMTKLRNGEKIAIERLFHFEDAHIEQVNEILQSNFLHGVECFKPNPFFVAFVQLTELGNLMVAKAISIELLNQGYDIRSAAKAYLESPDEDQEDEVADTIHDFVRECEREHLHERLQSKLNTNGSSKKTVLKKI